MALLKEIDLRIGSFLLFHEYMYRDGVSNTGVEQVKLFYCGMVLNEKT